WWERLGFKYVKARTGDAICPQDFDEIRFANDLSACSVDKNCRGFHKFEMFAPHHACRFGREAHVQADDVGPPEDLIKGYPFSSGTVGMECPGDDMHPDSLRKFRDLTANRTGSNQAKCFTLKLGGQSTRPLPFSHLMVDRHGAFRDGDDQRERMFGHRDDG